MKKNVKVISNILMFISFLMMSFYMYIFSSSLFNASDYGFTSLRYRLLWLGFSLSWIFLFLAFILSFKGKKRLIVFYVLNFLLLVLFNAQICYVEQLGKFMIFSDLFVAGEGLQYAKSILCNLNFGMILTTIFSLIIMIIIACINKKKKDETKTSKKIIIILLIISFIFRIISYFGLGSASHDDTWKENFNAKNIYTNFTNPNTSMYISGYYEYTFRSIYKYFYNLITIDKTALRTEIDNYNNLYGINMSENEYTGLFKGKNVIFVMMESIDSWIIDDDTMPTLNNLKNTGWNFTNRYSPFFNGGQTINTEFALNSGMYAISNKDTIYDIDDVDYPYSLANMLKQNGYKANSFHANTGEFYNRTNFHKRLGYSHHYSALDMQRAKMLDKSKNYYIDSNFIKDDKLFDLMTKDEPFISFYTTYSAHLEYTEFNRIYRSLKHNLKKSKYTDEEYIYRTLAHDTDNALRQLIKKLKKKNLLDNTVLVLVSDHYVYGYSDPNYVAIKKHVINDRKELQNTPFIIWSNSIDSKEINTILDSADILPTLFNLLGVSYDPNKYMGTDVFSNDHDKFVWFSDGSYIKDDTCTLSDDAILTKCNLNIKKNKDILLTNYYGK